MVAGKVELYEPEITPASEKGTGTRSRGWCFVINNYTDDDKATVTAMAHAKRPHPVYIIVGEEVGKKGTPHLQGYVYFETARVFSVMKKALPRANLQQARGTGEDNKTYCSKEGKVWLEEGEPPVQGERTDLQEVYAMLRDGATLEDVLDTEPNYQCIAVSEKWLKYKEPARDFKPTVHWLWGDPGTGKSRDAAAAFKGVFYSPPSTSVAKFWDGYDAHENVIIDDIDPGDIPYRSLLRILDRYAYRVETKGGSRQLLAKVIYICTEKPPASFVPEGKDAYALMRRLTSITQYIREKGVQPNYYPAVHVKVVADASGSQNGDQAGPVQEKAPADCSVAGGKNIKRENNLDLQIKQDALYRNQRTRDAVPGICDSLFGGEVCDPRPGGGGCDRRQSSLPVCQESGFGCLQVRDTVAQFQEKKGCTTYALDLLNGWQLFSGIPGVEDDPCWPSYDGLQEDDDADSG